jgi:hypothetical protein
MATLKKSVVNPPSDFQVKRRLRDFFNAKAQRIVSREGNEGREGRRGKF